MSPPSGRIEVPAVVSQFPRDLLPVPRPMAERLLDVRVWQEPGSGGHFPAWERPEAFVDGVRAALALA